MKLKKLVGIFLVLMLTLSMGCSTLPPSDDQNVQESPKGEQPVQKDDGNKDTPKKAREYTLEIDLFQELGINSVDHNLFLSPNGETAIFAGSNVLDPETGKPLDMPAGKLILVDLISGGTKVLDTDNFIRVQEWSPDGEKVLYMKGSYSMYVVEVNGGKPIKIADDAYCGSFSPDSSQIAYVQLGKGIYTAGIDGSSKKAVTTKKGDWYPVWYPDGKQLFYFADQGVALGDGAGQLQGLAKIDLATGKKETFLPDETGKYRGAEWIIPGESLYVDKGFDDGFYDLIVNLKQGKIADLGENPLGGLRLTTIDKNDKLVYKAYKDEVVVYDAEGAKVRSLPFTKPDRGQHLINYGYAISPDGEKLAYLFGETGVYSGITDAKGGTNVWVVDKDGSNPKQLTDKYSYYRPPFWTPEGKHLVTVESRSGGPATSPGELLIRIIDL